MRRQGRNSLCSWFGVSLAVHVSAALALWQIDFAPKSLARAKNESVVVSLVAHITSEADTPKALPTPPVSSPPRGEVQEISSPRPTPKPTPETKTKVSNIIPPTPKSRPTAEVVDLESVDDDEHPTEPAVAAAATIDSATGTAIDPISDYVASVRARIDSKKRYPAMSRRRSEEGLLFALLSIASSGRLERVEVRGAGPVLLRRATRAAVEQAAPFPMPPRGPIVIEIPIRWRVRH